MDNGCLPVFAYDTTSACAESVVKDSFGDSDSGDGEGCSVECPGG